MLKILASYGHIKLAKLLHITKFRTHTRLRGTHTINFTHTHTHTHTYLKDVSNAEHAQSSQMPQPNADMQTNAATLHTVKYRLEISAFDLCEIEAFGM